MEDESNLVPVESEQLERLTVLGQAVADLINRPTEQEALRGLHDLVGRADVSEDQVRLIYGLIEYNFRPQQSNRTKTKGKRNKRRR
ncbi:MAG: hypothetical protein AAB467_00745 [Patescibacteria group bacterium]